MAALLLVVGVTAGCAWQSQVLKLGPHTFQTSANASPARGGPAVAREMAVRNANRKCDELGKGIEAVDIQTQNAWPSNGVATVTFKCN